MRAVAIMPGASAGAVGMPADIEVADPSAHGRDLLVRIEAVSVNPLDLKMRTAKPLADGALRISGWDAAGVVLATGPDAVLFAPGDQVFYAGSILRQGTNAQLHVVDERVVGRMPESLDFGAAAALPLTALTAWEALFDRMRIDPGARNAGKTVLVMGGAGGVGSMAIQLAKQVAALQVIATASHTASREWCRQLGADLVIDHSVPLKAQLASVGIKAVDYILCLAATEQHFSTMASLIAPHGNICCIVETAAALPMNELRAKSASFSWEGVFTRAIFETADMTEQHFILNQIAALVDAGTLRTTLREVAGTINAHNLLKAYDALATGHGLGKLVLQGFAGV
ncbi:MAG: zinc-binding alcohol dehydrogenase family protein [Burkholderiaceae bacterium]